MELMPVTDVWLQDLRFEHPLVLGNSADFAPQVLLEIGSLAKEYTISSRPASSVPTAPWRTCSSGRINALDKFPCATPETLDTVRSRVQAGKSFNVEKFYQTLDRSGLRYGEAFRGVQELFQLGTEIFAHVALFKQPSREAARFHFHPALLDACVHTMFADLHHRGNSQYIYLPHHIKNVQIFDAKGSTEAFVHTKIQHHDNTSMQADFHIYNQAGRVIATITGLTVKRLLGATVPEPLEYEVTLEEEALSTGYRTESGFGSVWNLGEECSGLCSLARETFPAAKVSQYPLSGTKQILKTAWKK